MKGKIKLLVSIIFTLITYPVIGQKTIKLEGIIGMEGGELFSYDLTASEVSPFKFEGTVKTYALRDQEVLAEVILNVNPHQKTVELIETKILGNNGFKSNVTICLVRAVLNWDDKKGVLKGPIITQTAGDGMYCAIGNVTFLNGNEIARLFNEDGHNVVADATPIVQDEKKPENIPNTPRRTTATPKSTPPVAKPTVSQQSAQQPSIPKPRVITEGKSEQLIWKSSKLIVDIFDDNDVDGDMVSVFFNNKEVLSNYRLQKDKKRLELDLSQSELNILVVKAMNMGADPPNTAMLYLYDGDTEYKIKAYNDPGKTSEIRIIYNFDVAN